MFSNSILYAVGGIYKPKVISYYRNVEKGNSSNDPDVYLVTPILKNNKGIG